MMTFPRWALIAVLALAAVNVSAKGGGGGGHASAGHATSAHGEATSVTAHAAEEPTVVHSVSKNVTDGEPGKAAGETPPIRVTPSWWPFWSSDVCDDKKPCPKK